MEEFDQLVGYLDQCLGKGRINHHQRNHLLCILTEGGDIHQVLEEMKLEDGYQSYRRKGERDQVEQAYQKSLIQDFIKEINQRIKKLNQEIVPFQEEFDEKKNHYETRYNHAQRYPDNPRYRQIADQARQEMDLVQVKLIKYQQELEECQRKIKTWEQELAANPLPTIN